MALLKGSGKLSTLLSVSDSAENMSKHPLMAAIRFRIQQASNVWWVIIIHIVAKCAFFLYIYIYFDEIAH